MISHYSSWCVISLLAVFCIISENCTFQVRFESSRVSFPSSTELYKRVPESYVPLPLLIYCSWSTRLTAIFSRTGRIIPSPSGSGSHGNLLTRRDRGGEVTLHCHGDIGPDVVRYVAGILIVSRNTVTEKLMEER